MVIISPYSSKITPNSHPYSLKFIKTPKSQLSLFSPKMAFSFCSTKSFLALFLLSAIPISYVLYQELSPPPTHVFHYHSSGFLRECAKWDDIHRRFIVTFLEGGIGEIRVPDDYTAGSVLEEVTVVKDGDLAGNSTVGFVIDRPRNRIVVVSADVIGNKFSALSAYDLTTWKRLFLTKLSGPSDEKAFADDVAVDAEGNAYITDAKASKLWKVGKDGDLLSVIRSPLFVQKEWYKNLIALNGIVYHPDGFLIVIHTVTGNLYKIDLANGEEVKLIKVENGSLVFGDGLELLSPTKLVVAGNPSGRLVESSDRWETASVVAKAKVSAHRLATAATVKDGKVYFNHLLGMGYPKKKHALVEAVFTS